ncbi:25S rRNA (adenine645-N1)-methyltransferase, variant 2 [Batrachochytrium dendrobatidis]|nr:25S rRNA (adenine645-N1)-methyltransferase, variant 2 [Batrachochytrium dendrobatidis]KAK5672074.1 25S rRNA (adenine645-N1)-methyltransferase, variant 2 [Batrachochytrium dendrobatidis]
MVFLSTQKLLKQKLKQALDKAKVAKKSKEATEKTAKESASNAATKKNQVVKPGPRDSWPKGPLYKPKQPVLAKVDKAPPKSNLTELQEKMHKQLAGAKFRWINEKLYTTSSKEAVKLFKNEPELFGIYHAGFSSQVKDWPVNPIDIFIDDLRGKPPFTLVADMGCGEAKVAAELGRMIRVESFDLVAANEYITACDIAHVPLAPKTCDVVIFCLSLMGTNFVDFLKEAYRILKFGGNLKIAEVVSRINNLDQFIKGVCGMGFTLESKDSSNKICLIQVQLF